MLETVKTVAIITSASVAFCAFVVGLVHYVSIFIKKLKARREAKLITKNKLLEIEKTKEALYEAFLNAQKKEVK